MKNDMEYSAAREYTTLPDEYLQGGGNVMPEKESGKALWKKIMYMTAALAVMAYTAVGAFASPDTPVPPLTDHPPLMTEEPDKPQEPENPNSQPEKQQPIGQACENRKDSADNAEQGAMPYYPVEGAISSLTVYNDSYDPETSDNRILMQDYVSESLFIQGDIYNMPAYEPVDGYLFMGWIVYYDKAVSSGPLLSMLGDALTKDNICYIKPKEESGGGRDIEIHAAWRYDGIGVYPYLLVLDANGGTIEDKSSLTYDAKGPMVSGAYVYLCAYPTPVREGYTFTGWYTETDGGDRITRLFGMDFYEKKGDEYDWSHTKTITLYAGWAKD